MLDNAGLEVVGNDARGASAVEIEHADMTQQPGVLLHVERRLDVVIAAVRQRTHEEVDFRRLADLRIDDGHDGARPVDFYRAPRLALYMRRQITVQQSSKPRMYSANRSNPRTSFAALNPPRRTAHQAGR